MTRMFLPRAAARHPTTFTVVLLGVLLALVVALAWVLGARSLRTSVQESTEASNRTLTRVFVNENWDAVLPLLPPPGSGAEAAAANPHIAAIDQIVRRFGNYTDVLKVKIYDLGGMTVYSSERKQIGEDKSRNLGFQAAARGGVASEMIYRGKFGGFDGEVYDRNLVSTYVPVRVGERVEAVVEIYADRTPSIDFINRELRSFVLWTVPLVLLAMLLTAAAVRWLQREQRAIARERLLAEDASLRSGLEAAAAGARAWARMDRLPAAFEGLGAVAAGVRADTAAPHDAPSAQGWQGLLQRVDLIDRWASVRADLAWAAHDVACAPQTLDLDGLVQQVMATLEPRARVLGRELLAHRHPAALGSARSDGSVLPRLLTHLVAASLEAPADEGKPARVQVKFSCEGPSLHVDVVDDCAGVAQAQLEAWFQGWDRGESLPPPDAAGLTGRHLLVARALAQRLGGRFDARGTPGHGNRWLVDLPLERASADPSAST